MTLCFAPKSTPTTDMVLFLGIMTVIGRAINAWAGRLAAEWLRKRWTEEREESPRGKREGGRRKKKEGGRQTASKEIDGRRTHPRIGWDGSGRTSIFYLKKSTETMSTTAVGDSDNRMKWK